MILYILSIFVSLTLTLLCLSGLRDVTIRNALIVGIIATLPILNLAMALVVSIIYMVESEYTKRGNSWLDKPFIKKK